MSTYVTRIVQVKKDDKWMTVPLYTTIKPEYVDKPALVCGDTNLYDINKRCDNFIYGRDTFRDEWSRGWDKTCPEIEYYTDSSGKSQPVGYNYGIVYCEDLYKKSAELEQEFIKYIKKLKSSEIEHKLNKLLSHFDIPFNSSEDSYTDEDMEWIMEDYLYPAEVLFSEASFAKDIAEKLNVYSSFDVRICFYFD